MRLDAGIFPVVLQHLRYHFLKVLNAVSFFFHEYDIFYVLRILTVIRLKRMYHQRERRNAVIQLVKYGRVSNVCKIRVQNEKVKGRPAEDLF